MATRLDEPLAGATLSDSERRIVERLVARLREVTARHPPRSATRASRLRAAATMAGSMK
jgi:hypothetical protein